MELAIEQTAWADEHIGSNTTVAVVGKIAKYVVNDDGTVTFHVEGSTDTATFVAWPPATAEQVAAAEAERQASDEIAAQQQATVEEATQKAAADAQAAADAALEDKIKAIVSQVLSSTTVATTA